MLKSDEVKLALDDVRARQIALLQLIYFTDQQAIGLLRLYVTVGVAAATAASAGFSGNSSITMAAAVALSVVALLLLIGCLYCYRAMATAKIGLPGKGPEFWTWALDHPDVNLSYVVSQYLEQTRAILEQDRDTNRVTANALKRAKQLGAAALAAALLVALVSCLISVQRGFLGTSLL
jgi:hypothetical protein